MKKILFWTVLSIFAASTSGCNLFNSKDKTSQDSNEMPDLSISDMAQIVKAATKDPHPARTKTEQLRALVNTYVDKNPVNQISFGNAKYHFVMDGYELSPVNSFMLSPHIIDSADTLASILKNDNTQIALTFYTGDHFTLPDEKDGENKDDIIFTMNESMYGIRGENVYQLNPNSKNLTGTLIGSASDRTIHSKPFEIKFQTKEYANDHIFSPELPAIGKLTSEVATEGFADYLLKTGIDHDIIKLDGISTIDGQKAYIFRVEINNSYGDMSRLTSTTFAVREDKQVYRYSYTPTLMEIDAAEVNTPKIISSDEFFIDFSHIGQKDTYEHFELIYTAPKLKITGNLTPETGAETVYTRILKSYDNSKVFTYKEIIPLSNGSLEYKLTQQDPHSKYWIYFTGVDDIDGQEALVYNIDDGWANYAVTHDQKIYEYKGEFKPVGTLPEKYPKLILNSDLTQTIKQKIEAAPDKYQKQSKEYINKDSIIPVKRPVAGHYFTLFIHNDLDPFDPELCKLPKMKNLSHCKLTDNDLRAIDNVRSAADFLIRNAYTGEYDSSKWILLGNKLETINGENAVRFTVGQGIADPDSEFALIPDYLYQVRFEGAVTASNKIYYYKDGKPEQVTATE